MLGLTVSSSLTLFVELVKRDPVSGNCRLGVEESGGQWRSVEENGGEWKESGKRVARR